MTTIHTVFSIISGIVSDDILTTVNVNEAREEIIKLAEQLFPKRYKGKKPGFWANLSTYEMIEEINSVEGSSNEICYRESELKGEEPTAFGFDIDDILQQAEDDGVILTREQGADIIQQLLNNGDASIGVNWDTVSDQISIYVDNVIKR